MCGTLDILSDLYEVRLNSGFPFFTTPSLATCVKILRGNDDVGNAQRDDVRKSFEFLNDHVGQDKDSGEKARFNKSLMSWSTSRHETNGFTGL